MPLLSEKEKLQLQQQDIQSNAQAKKELACSRCNKPLSACKCAGKGGDKSAGAGNSDDNDNGEMAKMLAAKKTNSRTSFGVPQLLFSQKSSLLLELLKKDNKLKTFEVTKALKKIKSMFEKFVRDLAKMDGLAPQDFSKQGYKAKIEGDLLSIKIPDAERQQMFLQIIRALIKPVLTENNDDTGNNTPFRSPLDRILHPKLRPY